MKEIWKDIPGYEGVYQVSNTGRVKSLERIKEFSRVYLGKEYTQRQKISEKIMRPFRNIDGYTCVKLSKEGRYKEGRVHRLVASAFLGLDLDNYETLVCHKNDIRDDNTLDNLFIGTQKENIQDCIRKGRRNLPQGENNHNSVLKNEQVINIRKRLSLGDRIYLIAKDLGVSQGSILRIKEGITYKSVVI